MTTERARMERFYAHETAVPHKLPRQLRAAEAFVAQFAAEADLALEVGCGAGQLARQVADHGPRVIGLDISLKNLSAALAQPGAPISCVAGSAADLPWADNSFDLVYSHQVVEHLPDVQRSLREQVRVLKPGGLLLVVAPSLMSPLGAVKLTAAYVTGKYGLSLFARDPYEGKTVLDAFLLVFENTWRITRKILIGGDEFPRREPLLVEHPHGDIDAVWVCNPIDLRRVVERNGCQLLPHVYGRTGWAGPYAATTYLAARKLGPS